MNKKIALLGNPNCGKTTLFNALTGTYQKVGNWAGVTTEVKDGVWKKDKNVKIIDLPGVYSFSALSLDEQAVENFLKTDRPDCIINVVDGTNLERNLYLTVLASRLKIPTVIAVNFCDELEKAGAKINVFELSNIFGVPAVGVSALKNINLDDLMELALNNRSLIKYSGGFLDGEIYGRVEAVIKKVCKKRELPSAKFTKRVDAFLMNKYIGLPLFVAVIFVVYLLANGLGGYLSGGVSEWFVNLSKIITGYLDEKGVPEILISFFINGVIKGVGTVLSFLPQILILFFLLAILEESGYMARVSFLTDAVFKNVGLGGKSVIPMVLSCGCAVTGAMATRTIDNERERKATLYLSPFMPCGAKCAVFGWFSVKFFNGSPFVSVAMYFLAVAAAIVSGKLLYYFSKNKNKERHFILEIPPFRRPSAKDVFMVLKEKVKEFLIKSGTVIFLVSAVVWFLNNFGFNGYTFGNIENSFIYHIGEFIKFIFYPLGFGNWKAAVSAVTGIFAKEAVMETAEILGLSQTDFFSVYSVWAFMAFTLLSPPCVAALAVIKKELNSKKDFLFCITFQFLTGYFFALIINLLGVLFSSVRLILCVIIAIISLIGIIASFKALSCRNKTCNGCKGKERCRIKSKRNTIT